MREIVPAGLFVFFSLFAPLLLERYMTNCPEWALKVISLVCMVAAIYLIGNFDPIYERVWGQKFSPLWSTAFIFITCGVLGASLWWNLVASGIDHNDSLQVEARINAFDYREGTVIAGI
jgi:hypothetical protein